VKATIASTCLTGTYTNSSAGAPATTEAGDRCPGNPFDKSGPSPPLPSAAVGHPELNVIK
jgi:hypothetical protein